MEDEAIAEVREYMRRVREELDRIERLLEDPHPGLATWCILVGARVREIRAIALGGNR